jgi:hypothetical protein
MNEIWELPHAMRDPPLALFMGLRGFAQPAFNAAPVAL